MVLPIVLQNGIEIAVKEFKSVLDAWQLETQNASTAMIFQGIPQDVVFQLVFYVMCVFMICQIQDGRRTVQDFISLFLYMNQLHVPLHSLGASVQDFLKAVVNSERLIMTLKEESEMGNIVGARQMIECAADIEFDSVAAGSLESLTFRCEKETTTVIWGVPNSERPSFTQLLVRITKPKTGIIKIGGIDVRGYIADSLRRNVGLIPHECHLLGKNIMQSLKHGLQNSESIEDTTVFAACQTTNIHDTIMKIPGGYYAPVGRNGCGLGREEMRRLALTRLILQECRNIVCDGAITALHGETDQDLQRVLKESFHLRTVLVIE